MSRRSRSHSEKVARKARIRDRAEARRAAFDAEVDAKRARQAAGLEPTPPARKVWEFRVRGGGTLGFDFAKGVVSVNENDVFQGVVAEMPWDGVSAITERQAAAQLVGEALQGSLGKREDGEA